jgi:hypothetical protein
MRHLTRLLVLPIGGLPLFMPRIFQFTALLLLAVWVPTTVHCNLEAAFDWATESCCGEHADEAPAPVEHCGVEDGGYRIADSVVAVSAPALWVCWCFEVVRAQPPPAIGAASVTEHSESPPELIRTWQFIVRTALPVRAPSTVS